MWELINKEEPSNLISQPQDTLLLHVSMTHMEGYGTRVTSFCTNLKEPRVERRNTVTNLKRMNKGRRSFVDLKREWDVGKIRRQRKQKIHRDVFNDFLIRLRVTNLKGGWTIKFNESLIKGM